MTRVMTFFRIVLVSRVLIAVNNLEPPQEPPALSWSPYPTPSEDVSYNFENYHQNYSELAENSLNT